MLTLVRWLSRLPLWLLHAVGAWMGWVVWALSATYRHRMRDNLLQAGVSAIAARPAVAEAGRQLFELPYLWMRPPDAPLVPPVRWDGVEQVAEAVERGKGIVFLTPHLGCFEVTAQAYAERFARDAGPITVLYRPARKVWLREVVAQSRNRPGLAAAPATLAGVRQMVRALRRGEAVGLLPDQVPPEGLGVWAPFFGRDAYTMTLAARLIQLTGATPLIAWGERLPRGAGYVVHVLPFPDPLPEGEAAQAECAAIVNRAMERLILQRPQQYLWGYHRYKTPRRLE
jgi:KDO2-lipid IV(A) lauroyltransferase